jgi:hypothetical protein
MTFGRRPWSPTQWRDNWHWWPEKAPVIYLKKEKEPEEAPPPVDSTPAVFKLQVVLDKDGAPVKGLSLGLKTQVEKAFRDFTTNGQGRIVVEHTLKAPHEVRSDMTDARLDECAVVVGMGDSRIEQDDESESETSAESGESGAEAPEEAPPIRHIVQLNEYKVRNGDTPDSIAARMGLKWPFIALFNWGTLVPTEIHRHLVLEVGYAGDAKDVTFTGKEEPGILRIPRQFMKDGLMTDEENVLRVKLAVERRLAFVLQCDPKAPHAQNDVLILETADGTWRHELPVAGLEEVRHHWVRAVFPLPLGGTRARFNLIKDPKDNEKPLYIFRDQSYGDLSDARAEHVAEEARQNSQ